MNAIEKVKGPCVILAGAGTGKTYTIVEKVKYLISQDACPPEKIVCITFSNEAANNISLRIKKVLNEGKEPIVRTFHGFSADLLREHGEKIGIKNFKILDPDQAKILLHRNLRVPANNCHSYIGTLGTAKDLGIKIEEFQKYISQRNNAYGGIDLLKRLENLNFELQTLHLTKKYHNKKDILQEVKNIKNFIEMRKFVNAWSAYEKVKQKSNYQDYSDLNANALALLSKNPEIADSYRYIIVDEFQDTNKVQLDLLSILAPHKNITIVGDINQSIYRFRGAYKENLAIFKNIFSVKDSEIFRLSNSYRSPNVILRTAHSLISHNYANKDECLFVQNAHNREGEKIEAYELKDAREEARKIIEIIEKEKNRGTAPEEICVMFRTHQQGRIVRRSLERAGIPYVAIAKSSLLKQKSVKTARDFLIIIDKLKRKDKGGEQAWWDLIYALGFPSSDLVIIGREIKNFFEKKGTEETLSTYLVKKLPCFNFSKRGSAVSKILCEKISSAVDEADKPISELLQAVYAKAGLVNGQKTRQEKEIMLNLNKFYEIAKSHEELYDSDLSNFLYYLEVLESLGIELEASTLEESGVRLMTSHATKGLEFSTVILTNMAQGRFPIERYINNSLIPTELLPEVKHELSGLSEGEKENFIIAYEKHNQLLEERRLAYVSFTRAKEKLFLTFAAQYGDKKTAPSQFLSEIRYKDNGDILHIIDSEQKYVEPESELKPALHISSLIHLPEFEENLAEMLQEPKREERKLSPSALLLFDGCQKQFEYKYIYNMPERKGLSWEAMRLGSFVHLVLERGVSSGFKTIEEFMQLARELSLDEDWESITLPEAETLIKVFFARNQGRYNGKSKTEQYLSLTLSGMEFIGFADRIDFTPDGVNIIDYKTGKSTVAPKDRNWQLGFYALAAQKHYGTVRKVVLDMLKQEKPLEFEIDDRGNARCLSSQYIDGFNIYEIQDELVNTAKAIHNAYEKGFRACAVEKNCEFCNEYVYGL